MEQSYERMRRILKQTGLYRLDGRTLADAELMAYSAVFDRLYESVAALLSDCFFDEVDSPKGERFETMFGFPRTRFPLVGQAREERLHKIELMKTRLNVKNNCFQPEEMVRQIATGGMEVSLAENPAAKKITVKVLSDRNYLERMKDKEAFIRQILPCHSTVEIIF